jgi:hypothetical protein
MEGLARLEEVDTVWDLADLIEAHILLDLRKEANAMPPHMPGVG